MQKQEFLKKLRRELQWYLSRRELKEVLQEYEGYFAAASSNGTDESIAAAELGDPALVATEVLSERRGGIAEVRHNKPRIIAAAVLLVMSVMYCAVYFTPYSHIFPMPDIDYDLAVALAAFNLLFLLPTALALLLGLGRTDRSRRGNTGWLFGTNIVVTAVIWALWYSALYLPMITLMYAPDAPITHWLFWGMQIDAIGILYAALIMLLFLVAVAFVVVAGLQVVRHQLVYIPLLYLNCTTMLGLYKFEVLLQTMSDAAVLPAETEKILLNVGFGVLITAAVALLLFLRRRRVSE